MDNIKTLYCYDIQVCVSWTNRRGKRWEWRRYGHQMRESDSQRQRERERRKTNLLCTALCSSQAASRGSWCWNYFVLFLREVPTLCTDCKWQVWCPALRHVLKNFHTGESATPFFPLPCRDSHYHAPLGDLGANEVSDHGKTANHKLPFRRPEEDHFWAWECTVSILKRVW